MQTSCQPRLNIIIIGAPGSGKGTQAKKIADHYGLTHITSGDLLRKESQRDTDESKEIKKLMSTGQLFPDSLVKKVLLAHVPKENFVLDGYPRKVSQVDTFSTIDAVIYLDLPEDVAIKRILKRKEGRVDDNEKTAKVRFSVFAKETKPVVEYYREKGILVVIDGNKSIDDVFSIIKEEMYKKFCV